MVDLHSHTTRSDGTLEPDRLVQLACANGLRTLAITDHDTVAGYDDACESADQSGLDLVCGVELGAKFDGRTIHVLGYFLDVPADQAFRTHLDRMAATRRDRNRRLAEKLQEFGVDLRLEEAEALGSGQTGRPHFARLLVKKGYATDFRDAFNLWLDEKAKAFVPRDEATLADLCEWMRASGGIPVWAHPGRHIKASPKSAAELFAQIRDAGVPAIECFHRDHNIHEAESYAADARKLGMGVTGGSDFHSPGTEHVPLGGLQLPDSLLDDFRNWAAR